MFIDEGYMRRRHFLPILLMEVLTAPNVGRGKIFWGRFHEKLSFYQAFC